MRTHALPPACIFDRADRLSALAARARELAHALYRERCDAPASHPEAAPTWHGGSR